MGSCSVTVVHRATAIYRAVIHRLDCMWYFRIATTKQDLVISEGLFSKLQTSIHEIRGEFVVAKEILSNLRVEERNRISSPPRIK